MVRIKRVQRENRAAGGAMKTLVVSSTIEQTPLFISNIVKCNQKPLILHSRTTSFKLFADSRIPSSWKLQAEAKGFGSSPPEKRIQREGNTTTGKSSESNKNDDEEEIPQEVYNRMVGRIVFSVGVPIGTGIGLLSLFGHVKEQNLWDVPMWLPVVTTFITFGSSALGIAYGTLSTSWDPEQKGSFLGIEQLEKNWTEMWKEEEEEKAENNNK